MGRPPPAIALAILSLFALAAQLGGFRARAPRDRMIEPLDAPARAPHLGPRLDGAPRVRTRTMVTKKAITKLLFSGHEAFVEQSLSETPSESVEMDSNAAFRTASPPNPAYEFKAPGFFLNESVYILGARISARHDDPGELWFDIFLLDPEVIRSNLLIVWEPGVVSPHNVSDSSTTTSDGKTQNDGNGGIDKKSATMKTTKTTKTKKTKNNILAVPGRRLVPSTIATEKMIAPDVFKNRRARGFRCHFNETFSVPAVMVSQVSTDVNSLGKIIILRCNLSRAVRREVLARRSHLFIALERRRGPRPSTTTKDADRDSCSQTVATFDVPVRRGGVGQAAPDNLTPRPFLAFRPFDTLVCLGGVHQKGVDVVEEWLHYHLLIGVQHVVIGVHDPLDTGVDGDWGRLSRVLNPLMRAGIVSLQRVELPRVVRANRDMLKTFFYTSCLYHAKGIARNIGVWDVDEYWAPNLYPEEIVSPVTVINNEGRKITGLFAAPPRPMPTEEEMRDHEERALRMVPGSLTRYLRSYRGSPACPDWSYVTFLSRTCAHAHRKTHTPHTGVVAWDYETAAQFDNTVWKKSIARTKNVFLEGFHIPGSILRNGSDPNATYVPDYKHPNECAARSYNGTMLHFAPLFYGRVDAATLLMDLREGGSRRAPFPNTYSVFMKRYLERNDFKLHYARVYRPGPEFDGEPDPVMTLDLFEDVARVRGKAAFFATARAVDPTPSPSASSSASVV